MTTNRMAYDALQTAMARQRITVYDLYGLLEVSPNVDEVGIRRAYEAIARKLHPEMPSNVVNIAYSILVNPFKRAQYDRDRLEYLYKHFNTHESFPATNADLPNRSFVSRDEQIQFYATTLVNRVKDPIEDKKKAIIRRIATIRNEVDEFNELSLKQRQDWATSNNRVLRMAGNALCEVVVCAVEDLRMLEDELGRIDGVLEPKDKDGPAGRVTSGQYGSDVSMNMLKGRPRVLMDQRVPSVPRSPTVLIHPKSASKLGVQGQDISGLDKDNTPSSEGSEAARELRCGNRVNDFLLGPSNVHVHHQNTTNATHMASDTKQQQPLQARMSSLIEAIIKTNSQANPGAESSSRGMSMGLVDYQRVHGLRNVDDNLNNDDVTNATHQDTQNQYNDNSESNPGDLRMSHPPLPASASWHGSWGPSYGLQSTVGPPRPFGLHVSHPALRSSATASNTALFKESQDRAAAAARAPGRWIVGGPGLTNFNQPSGQAKKEDSNDPFA